MHSGKSRRMQVADGKAGRTQGFHYVQISGRSLPRALISLPTRPDMGHVSIGSMGCRAVRKGQRCSPCPPLGLPVPLSVMGADSLPPATLLPRAPREPQTAPGQQLTSHPHSLGHSSSSKNIGAQGFIPCCCPREN